MRQRLPLRLMVPWVGLWLCFWFVPFARTIFNSVHANRIDGHGEWVGLRHFQHVLTDPLYATALRNTALYAIILIAFVVPLALMLAAWLRD
ncbi:hypothetical protein C2W62_14455 [Candidatus Entotheonella serta]|nr:hypothetical protein C2W62_14455 [Candidatus Entotheonella serta]